jgi:hypothetical protein
MSRPLPAHLVPIRESISRGDYRCLRNGGEQLVRDYARELGISVVDLIRSWAPPIDGVAARRNAQPEPEPEPAEDDDIDDVDDGEEDDRDDDGEDDEEEKPADLGRPGDEAGEDLEDDEEDDDEEDDDRRRVR